jgi:hypothetical protein
VEARERRRTRPVSLVGVATLSTSVVDLELSSKPNAVVGVDGDDSALAP